MASPSTALSSHQISGLYPETAITRDNQASALELVSHVLEYVKKTPNNTLGDYHVAAGKILAAGCSKLLPPDSFVEDLLDQIPSLTECGVPLETLTLLGDTLPRPAATSLLAWATLANVRTERNSHFALQTYPIWINHLIEQPYAHAMQTIKLLARSSIQKALELFLKMKDKKEFPGSIGVNFIIRVWELIEQKKINRSLIEPLLTQIEEVMVKNIDLCDYFTKLDDSHLSHSEIAHHMLLAMILSNWTPAVENSESEESETDSLGSEELLSIEQEVLLRLKKCLEELPDRNLKGEGEFRNNPLAMFRLLQLRIKASERFGDEACRLWDPLIDLTALEHTCNLALNNGDPSEVIYLKRALEFMRMALQHDRVSLPKVLNEALTEAETKLHERKATENKDVKLVRFNLDLFTDRYRFGTILEKLLAFSVTNQYPETIDLFNSLLEEILARPEPLASINYLKCAYILSSTQPCFAFHFWLLHNKADSDILNDLSSALNDGLGGTRLLKSALKGSESAPIAVPNKRIKEADSLSDEEKAPMYLVGMLLLLITNTQDVKLKKEYIDRLNHFTKRLLIILSANENSMNTEAYRNIVFAVMNGINHHSSEVALKVNSFIHKLLNDQTRRDQYLEYCNHFLESCPDEGIHLVEALLENFRQRLTSNDEREREVVIDSFYKLDIPVVFRRYLKDWLSRVKHEYKFNDHPLELAFLLSFWYDEKALKKLKSALLSKSTNENPLSPLRVVRTFRNLIESASIDYLRGESEVYKGELSAVTRSYLQDVCQFLSETFHTEGVPLVKNKLLAVLQCSSYHSNEVKALLSIFLNSLLTFPEVHANFMSLINDETTTINEKEALLHPLLLTFKINCLHSDKEVVLRALKLLSETKYPGKDSEDLLYTMLMNVLSRESVEFLSIFKKYAKEVNCTKLQWFNDLMRMKKSIDESAALNTYFEFEFIQTLEEIYDSTQTSDSPH